MKPIGFQKINTKNLKNIGLTVAALAIFSGTGLAQTYCTPIYSTGCSTGYDLQTVYLEGESVTLNNANSGCSTNGYGDFTATTNHPDLKSGTTYKVVVTIANSTSGATNYLAAWIDYNNDSTFQTSERFIDPNGNGARVSGTDSFSLTIPPMTTFGLHRMRIRLITFTGFHPGVITIDPCNSLNVGEAEDYLIQITSTNDAGVDSLITPDTAAGFCSGNQQVKVRIANFGSNDLHSVHVNWSVNDTIQNMQSLVFSPALNPVTDPNNDTVITLGTVNFPYQSPVDIKAWTSDPNGLNDAQAANDTLSVSLSASGGNTATATGITDSLQDNGSYKFTASGAQFVNSYLWDFGDGHQSTDSTPSHTYAQDGDYLVSLIVSNNCGSDTITNNIHALGLGISELNEGNKVLQIFPNPARGWVTIKNETGREMTSIAVYNILGQKVFQKNVKDGSSYKLTVNGYATGIYNVRVWMDDGSWLSRKIEVGSITH